MAWTTPHTLVNGEIWPSSDWNTYVKANLEHTMPGLATAANQYFVSTGFGALVARSASSARVETAQTTTSTSYTDLTTSGPAVTVTTGTRALCMFTTQMANATASAQCHASVAVSGATTVAADDSWSASLDGVSANNTNRYGIAHLFTGLTSGSNTFTMKYRAGSGTAEFATREIIVVPF